MAKSGASSSGNGELRDEGLVLEPKHKVFLSHSGAQKAFVEHLCVELERCFRFPFFDKRWDSLPIGENFPKHIFAAIQQCVVGVVILSEEFFTSKWPMMELVAMVEHAKKNPKFTIMPVYLRISIQEFKDPMCRIRWQSRWSELALENPTRLQVENWGATLNYLNSINSLEYDGLSEVKFQKEIINAICRVVPAGIRLEDSYIQGRSRLCKVILDKIDAQESSNINGVCVVGLYGMAGTGKTSICKALCNEYFTKFHGRVCLAELEKGSEEELLREVVQGLSNMSYLHGLSIYQLENGFKEGSFIKEPVFLALDNLLDSYASIKQVKRYLSAKLPVGSIVLVTTRSKDLLQNMMECITENNCMEMPELNMEEAKSLFVKSCHFESANKVDERLIERCVMRCCFRKDALCRNENDYYRGYYNYPIYYQDDQEYDDYYDHIRRYDHHYHPLALDVLGKQLGRIAQDKWRVQLRMIDEDIFNLTRENIHPIFSILKKTFYTLSLEDQLLFMDIALFLPHSVKGGCNVLEWLSMVHSIPSVDDVKSRLESLKTKSLLERLGDGTNARISMHDLWRSFCVAETKVGKLGRRRWAYVASRTHSELLYTTPSGIWQNVQRMAFIGFTGFTSVLLDSAPIVENALRTVNFAHFSNVSVLKISDLCMKWKVVLDLSALTHLKSLEVSGRYLDTFVLKGLPKGLIYLSLKWGEFKEMESNSSQHLLKQIEGLKELQYLQLINYGGEKLPNMSSMVSLHKAIFYYCKNVVTLLIGLRPNLPSGISSLHLKAVFQCCKNVTMGTSSLCPNLQVLDLQGCLKLQSCLGVADLVFLEELNCRECVKLERLPDLRKLTNLRKLDISECHNINEVSGLGDLVALVELYAGLSKKQSIHFKVPDMCKLKNLQVLHFGNRNLEALPGFDNLFSLRKAVVDFQNVVNKPSFQVTKLEKLKIGGCSLTELKKLHKLTMLQSLEIGTCNALDNLPNFRSLVHLQVLKIVDCQFKDVSELSNLIALERLQIEGCQNLERIPSLQKLTRLKIIEIRACSLLTSWDTDLSNSDNITNIGFEIQDSQMLLMGNLQTLTLWCCEQLADVMSIGAFSQLQTLDCWELGVKELPDLSNFQELRNLTLWKCESLEMLTSNMPMHSLSTLLVHGCGKLVTLPDLYNFPRLVELRLEEGKITTSRTLLHCSVPLTTLQLLVLRSTGSIEITLPDLGIYFPALKEIDLEGSVGLMTLNTSMPLPALQVLKLSKCIDLIALPDLKMFPTLKSLDVFQCCRLLRLNSSVPLSTLRELDARLCLSLNQDNLVELQTLCQNCHVKFMDNE